MMIGYLTLTNVAGIPLSMPVLDSVKSLFETQSISIGGRIGAVYTQEFYLGRMLSCLRGKEKS